MSSSWHCVWLHEVSGAKSEAHSQLCGSRPGVASGPGALMMVLGLGRAVDTLLDAVFLPPCLLLLEGSKSARMALDRKAERTVASGYRGNLWRGSTVKTFPLGSRFSVCHVSGSVTSGSHGIPLSALFTILSPPQHSYQEDCWV